MISDIRENTKNDDVGSLKGVNDTERSGIFSQDAYNPDKRIEANEEDSQRIDETGYDPDRRIEVEDGDSNDKLDNEGIRETYSDISENNDKPVENGLSEEEKLKIKEETDWSDEIINHIDNMDQYEIYKNAGLHEAEINGRKCLIKDIDLDYVDPKTGLTNRELMAKGRNPYDAKTGEQIQLHHMGQKSDAPFAELCERSEHGDGNDAILHNKSDISWRRNPELENKYNNEQRPDHWKERAGGKG